MRAHADQGFALPMALIGALAVLLSASTVMAMALGSRQQLQLELRTIQAVDGLDRPLMSGRGACRDLGVACGIVLSRSGAGPTAALCLRQGRWC